MGASCSSEQDQTMGSASATLAEDFLLDMGFSPEICRLYSVIQPDNNTEDAASLKVVVKQELRLEKSAGSLRNDVVAPVPTNAKKKKDNANQPKTLLLKRVTSENPIMLLRWYHTLDVLSQINHPGIPRVIDIHDEDHSQLSFVMEACEGGHILGRASRYSESNARKIIRQILEIVEYLHSRSIVHGDLRAEWFVFESTNRKDWKLKLTDYSLAQEMPDNNEETGESSTSRSPQRPRLHHDHEPCLHTTAPQVLHGGPHSKKGDMWSVGVILFRLLSGNRPFGDNAAVVHTCMRDGPTLAFRQPIWRGISPQAKDLIQRLLVVEPRDRLSAQQALKHGWFSSFFSTRTTRRGT